MGMSTTDGITLGALARLNVSDSTRLWGPSHLLLVKPFSRDDSAPVLIDTPSRTVSDEASDEFEALSTAQLTFGEEMVNFYVSPHAIVVPVKSTGRNEFTYSVTIGRARNCDIVLDDSRVSKAHCSITPPPGWPAIKGIWKILDLKSTNGTYVLTGSGKIPVSRNKPQRLPVHSELMIGPVSAVFMDPEGLNSVLEHAIEQWKKETQEIDRGKVDDLMHGDQTASF